MSPVVIMYFGVVLALLILAWGGIEVYRRYFVRKKIDARTMNTWVPLKPTSPADEQLPSDSEDQPGTGIDSSLPQQNGHYSESQRSI